MNTVKCPHCGKGVEVTEALQSQVKEELELALRAEFEKKKDTELLDLQKQLDEQKRKNEEFREQELKLREQARKLEEDKKDFELEVQRKLDAERKNIEENAHRKATDDFRLKDMEKEKVINDLKKALDEAQRKAGQGSQQLQGEILELDLEETLRSAFPEDEINPVAKGVNGADIAQVVKTSLGTVCGVILWESKRTKNWSDEWCSKLKTDLRSSKANIPAIVSQALPEEAKDGMGVRDGVWVCNYTLVVPLAILLRKNLYDVARQKAMSVDRGSKAEALYSFVTSHEFQQQVEALVEVYKEMTEQITKERMVFERSWKSREAQVKRLFTSTAGIVGTVGGIAGNSMPQIKGLDILELMDSETQPIS